MNVLDTLGLISSSFGQWQGIPGQPADHVEAFDHQQFQYISLQFHDHVVIGATAIGLTQHVGALRGLIQGRVSLGEWETKLRESPMMFMDAYLNKGLSATIR